MAAHHVPNLADYAVTVRGHHLQDHAYSAWSVTFEVYFLILFAFELACPSLDGALDILIRHIFVFGCGNRRPQPWVGIRVAAANTGGNADFADHLGEDTPPLGICSRLFVLDRRPFRMPRHILPRIEFRELTASTAFRRCAENVPGFCFDSLAHSMAGPVSA